MFVIIEELLNTYDKVMELKIYVDSQDTDLLNKYKDAAESHNNKLLKNKYHFDAGFDLYLPNTTLIYDSNNPVKKIDHEIICSATMYTDNDKMYNTGYYLYPRSSISKTNVRLANSIGIIDSGYRGHIIGMFDAIYISSNDIYINKFDRLLQICGPNLCPIIVSIVDKLEDLGEPTSRGTGGFGSTGK